MTKLQAIEAGGRLLYGYLSAATFTAQNDDDQGSWPWDDMLSRRPWDPTTQDLADIIDRWFIDRAIEDCNAFMGFLTSLMLHEFKGNGGFVTLTYEAKQEALSELERAGADFWFTRNGHGCGFWDGDWEHGDELTALAKHFPEVYDCIIYRRKLSLR